MPTESPEKAAQAEKPRTVEEFLISEDSHVIRERFQDAVEKVMRNKLGEGEVSLKAELAVALQRHGVSVGPHQQERLFWQLVCYEARKQIFPEMYGSIPEDRWKPGAGNNWSLVERESNISVPHLGRLLWGPDADIQLGIAEFQRQFWEFLEEKRGKFDNKKWPDLPEYKGAMPGVEELVESAKGAANEVRKEGEGRPEKPTWLVPDFKELREGRVLVMVRQASGLRQEYKLELLGVPYPESPNDWWVIARELPNGPKQKFSLPSLGIRPDPNGNWNAENHPVRWDDERRDPEFFAGMGV